VRRFVNVAGFHSIVAASLVSDDSFDVRCQMFGLERKRDKLQA